MNDNLIYSSRSLLLKIKSEIPATPVKVVKPTAPKKPRVYKRKPKPVVVIKHLFETDLGALLKHYRNTKTQDKRRSTILGKKVLKIKDNFTALKNSFISFPIRTEKKIFGKSGVVITAHPDSKPQCTENTIDIISQACSRLINKENAYAKTKFPQGFRIYMKITFVNHNDGQHYSVSIS